MHLTNKDSFVFYKSPKTETIYYRIGEWSKSQVNEALNTFVFTTFKGCAQKISGEKKILNTKVFINNNEIESTNTYSKEQYLEQVKDYIHICKNKTIEKIVLSRIVKAENKLSNIFSLFKKLCDTYDHSFNYILNHPNYGMWMGASPEILLTGKDNVFKTIALAGSQKWNKNINWRAKEIEEQQYVKTYIEKVLKNHSNNVKCITDLETIKAGNLAHLKSTFNFNINTSIDQLISSLHPTPAVCGIPLELTKELIINNEIHNRSLYTGYLGEMISKSVTFFVNLRCMKITSNEFNIYVGGGITSKSNPKEEWKETEIKAQTMLSLIEI